MNNKRDLMINLLDQYKRNPDQFSDRQAEKIAMMAKSLGLHFPKESKPFRKFAFDAIDTALLGLVPNSWRPESRGQSVFGETGADSMAGSIGSLLGIAGTGGLALANAPRIGRAVGRGYGKASTYDYAGKFNQAKDRVTGVRDNVLNRTKDFRDSFNAGRGKDVSSTIRGDYTDIYDRGL